MGNNAAGVVDGASAEGQPIEIKSGKRSLKGTVKAIGLGLKVESYASPQADGRIMLDAPTIAETATSDTVLEEEAVGDRL